jgi:hypothetical protein
VPAAVLRNQLRQDVLITSTRPNLESAASRMHCVPHPLLACLLGKVFHPEEVEPQILVWLHPRYPSQTTVKVAAYKMELEVRWCSSTL